MQEILYVTCMHTRRKSNSTMHIPFIFPDNDTIYWVDMGLSTISRAKRDQTWREDVVTNGIGRVEGIAVDWIAGESNIRVL